MCLFFFFLPATRKRKPKFSVHMPQVCTYAYIMFHMSMDMGLYLPGNERIQCTKTRAVLYSNPFLLDKLHHTKPWLAIISIASMI